MTELPTKKKSRERPRSDPNGFLVLTQYSFGFGVVWCKTDSGAEISKRNSSGDGKQCHIIPVSDLLAWCKSGTDELEAIFRL